mmetsp:Transcript_6322/g.39415  ORF Transcript_6322/g.39415 Transcript_6322/m.39415 type:complete len:765 (-) Transcript_6322:43-2337(-)
MVAAAGIESFANVLIPIAAVLGVAFSLFLWWRVSHVRVMSVKSRGTGLDQGLLGSAQAEEEEAEIKVAEIQAAIGEGANSFLFTEYRSIAVFMACFSLIVFFLLGSPGGFSTAWTTDKKGNKHAPILANGIFSLVSFIIGACTSILCGFLGMMIATYANGRVALEAKKGVCPAFATAFRSGAVMGFLLTSFGLINLFVLLLLMRLYFGSDWDGLFEAVTGYGLGGSSIALFGRVGGGIYTKAADVGADLVGKVEKDIPEDDPRNPAVIADNVGDNVGDIAGMGADLFGSFAESTCAALVTASLSSIGRDHDWTGMMFPLMLSAVGILVCLVTTFVATDINPAKKLSDIEHSLKMQLIISTVIMTPAVFILCMVGLPKEFDHIFIGDPTKVVKNYYVFFCVMSGLWAGLLIGLTTEYYTSNRFKPVQDVADSCRTGAATNIIFGLALGYKSCIIPAFAMAFAIFVSFTLSGMFGIACAALGMLGTLATGLAIDAYGPISDNAGGIAEMSEMGEHIRERTDALDAAGNTTAAIGKGFAIGSAALVSLALFGAYVTRAELTLASTSLLDAKVFLGLLIGAMLPYWFSAMTMKSVGKAALAMVEEVRFQFNTIDGLMEGTTKPDYSRCVEISTKASLKEMIPPGALVMGTPVITGIFFGTHTLAGLLLGALTSGVQMAISAANTGGAWDNAKKYIEAGSSEHAAMMGGKGSEAHKAAVIGDTVGDPLKDTSGPSLNILVKLMAVESLVFAPFFAQHTANGLIFKIFGL